MSINYKIFTRLLRTLQRSVSRLKDYIFEEDELMEYVFLPKALTSLSVDCFADDGGSYRDRKHILWFLFRNSYDGNTNEVIPVIVSKNPKIWRQKGIAITEGDLEKIYSFIRINKNLIVQLAKGEIENSDFLKRLRPTKRAAIS